MDIVISSLGMVSSVGRDVVTACAAIRAGIVRAQPLTYFQVLDETSQEMEPITGHPLRGLTEGFTIIGRWLQLARACVADLLHQGALPDSSHASFWRSTGVLAVTPYHNDVEDSHLYNWPAYKKLARGKDIRTDALRNYTSKSGTFYPIFPEGYRFLLKAPQQGDWDVSESMTNKNFKWDYRIPYIHNGHHLVTNSQLRKTINNLEKKFTNATLIVRRGLARAGYNLNHKVNMVILPMDRKVAGALNLPRHLITVLHRDHRAYSDYVERRLDKVMRTYEGELRKYVRKDKEHTKLAHEFAKEQIEALSEELYAQVTARLSKGDREANNPGYTGTLDTIIEGLP